MANGIHGRNSEHAPCCGSRRITVTDCFDRGLLRRRGRWFPVSGDRCSDDNGLVLQFALKVEDGKIDGVSFKGSTCITLIAFAELLAEQVTGLELKQAIRIDAASLVHTLREVPPAKRDRARLAIRALQSAIKNATINQGGAR